MINNSQRQILEAVLERLPEKHRFNIKLEDIGKDRREDQRIASLIASNETLDYVRAIINEFLEKESLNLEAGK